MRKHIRIGLLFGFSCLAFVLPGAAAQAAPPATVNVEVEGASQTLLAPTSVTTTTMPVVKDGEHSCSGGSAAGALELATSGKWNGEWFGGFNSYSVETILGETHAFEPAAAANYFWSYWLNDKPSSAGICEGELSSNESILFFPECFSESAACPPAPNPLGIAAPASAERGTPVSVTVTSFANANGDPSPAVGATVSGGGATATTDSSGHATLALTQTGNVQLQAMAPQSVRSETTVCVHSGSDGTCGTTGPAGSAATGTTLAAPEYKGPYAIVARAGGVLDSHVYARGQGPKLLSGAIATHAHVTAVELKLRRSYRGRCFAYDGKSTRFKRAPCGIGSFFNVGSSPSFSYLLPGALAPGRYVLDIQATDAAGNHTSLARGTSRIVFYVR